MSRKEPFLWDGVGLTFKSPEGGSTIEQVPGATIETARELASMLERSTTMEPATPPSVKEVLAQVALLEAEKVKPPTSI